MGQLPNYLDQGFDKNLQRGDSFGGGSVMLPDGGLPLGSSVGGASGVASSVSGSAELSGGSSNGTANLVEDQKQPSELASGEIAEHIIIASDGHIRGGATDYLVGDGFWLGSYQGSASDYRFFIGDADSQYMTYANGVLTINGSITATSGTIGGFVIGADYIRDAANTFGLASTVTGGNDVRFWAGDTFANRAIAPARILENGRADFTELYINGSEVTSSGTDLTGASGRGPIVTGANLITTTGAIGGNNMVGYSDATTKRFIVSKYEAAADLMYMKIGLSVDFGADLYQAENISWVNQGASAGSFGIVQIGTDVWLSGVNGGETWKNGSAVTVSGTARIGPIGHDPTNSYLLVNYSTTQIARFTGISGTTITTKKLDGTTNSMTFTLDSATVPTSITRAS